MAEPYRRKDSAYFWIAFTDPTTGKRKAVSTGCTALREAKIKARAIVAEADAGRAQGARTRITLGEALARFVARAQARKLSTADDAQDHADRLLGKREGKWGFDPDLQLRDLSNAHLDTLKTRRMAEGYSGNTINHELAALSAAWRQARDAKCEVGDGLSFSRVKVAVKTRWFTQEEFAAICRELHPDSPMPARGGGSFVPRADSLVYQQRADAHDLFVALCLMGGRSNEVNTLTLRALDQAVATLYGWKTGKERAVPIAGMLEEIVARRRAAAKPGQIYLFAGRAGITSARSCPSRAITRAINRAGCNASPHIVRAHGRATIHSCRHTFASWLLQGGSELADIQNLLGHSSILTTMRYSHLSQRKVVERAAGILGSMGRVSEAAPI